jgi:hypothetical protein
VLSGSATLLQTPLTFLHCGRKCVVSCSLAARISGIYVIGELRAKHPVRDPPIPRGREALFSIKVAPSVVGRSFLFALRPRDPGELKLSLGSVAFYSEL